MQSLLSTKLTFYNWHAQIAYPSPKRVPFVNCDGRLFTTKKRVSRREALNPRYRIGTNMHMPHNTCSSLTPPPNTTLQQIPKYFSIMLASRIEPAPLKRDCLLLYKALTRAL